MYRFFVPEENVAGDRIYITGDDVNHVRNVLRMKQGDEVVVSCGRGTDYECVIENIEPEQIQLEIVKEQPAITELPVKIILFQALPKKDKMDWIVQKAVELGVAEIVPVSTRRCVVKWDDKKAGKKRQRWEAIAKAAAKQSGRGRIPKIMDIMNMEEALVYAKDLDSVLIPYELCEDMAESVAHMNRAVQSKSVGVFIGPEGGFERGEVEVAMKMGAASISLGKRILRTETAGMTVLSILMFLIEAQDGGQSGVLS